MLLNPHGIILVTGPTGSGKTTTLYSALNEINKPTIKIITIEDPVESTISGVNHIQANVKAGLTFAVGLRSILRLDPDVIMIGEIRDSETAEIAVRAAITGHLVLSTLHTNDAPSTIIRLIDMGIQPFLVASSVVGVISQRLIKQICSNCSTAYPANRDELEILGMSSEEKVNLYRGRGCAMCGGSGYRGRLGVYEIMVMTSKHKEAISKNCTEGELRQLSVEHGMKTLRDNARKFVLSGKTTIEEMIRISYSND
ncbi:MAG: Type II secretion system protein E [Firmicutes bacterium ADurb.Bin419]|nr:MAG: Type II secretion system protein E [Firmicutes bacterium ADurb.Bin419]